MFNTPKWLPRRGRMMVDTINRHVVNDFFNRPDTWVSYEQACAVADDPDNNCDGVGYVLTEDDPYFFIDIDGQLGPDGQWSQLCVDICTQFQGAYVELSQSGRGLHIYGKASSIPAHSCKLKDFPVELYSKSKFVNITRMAGQGDPEHDCTTALHNLINTYFQPREVFNELEWADEPRDDWNGHVDDGELISAAMASASAASLMGGDTASFGDLWQAREDRLAVAYPDPTEKNPYDASAADAALAQHLAFWTGCHHERVMSLMRMSRLERPKWDKHSSYLMDTIAKACDRQVDVYGGRKFDQALADDFKEQEEPQPIVQSFDGIELLPNAGVPRSGGLQIMGITSQLKHFHGCVYIQSMNKIWVPGGIMLDRSRFDATYGGYDFQMDNEGERNNQSAWLGFTQTQAITWPKVQSMAFRPIMEPGQVFKEAGHAMVNTYWPANVRMVEGDPSLFLDHVRKLLPDENDQQILLAYMAACVQHVGVKFQWCPLVQGVEGNGKTLFSRVVAYALGRHYCHFPKAADIDNNFNGWLSGKLFIGIEDIHIPEKRADVMEALKPMITGEWQEVTLKGVDAVLADICANFMLNSNHKDALRKTMNDRRFAIFFTSQQSAEDLVRDGMGAAYFARLYGWLNDENGYAIVANYLANYEIPAHLNPANKDMRAPKTSTTDEALNAALGTVEQAILEAVEEERTGFVGGWVSSWALEQLLRDIKRTIAPNKRRDMMRSLGYDYHPALTNGRLNNRSEVDGGTKPRLFCKTDMGLASPKDVYHHYIDAQRGLKPQEIFG